MTSSLASCNACNTEFSNENDQKNHYKSEWHRYNLKRKVSDEILGTQSREFSRTGSLCVVPVRLPEVSLEHLPEISSGGFSSTSIVMSPSIIALLKLLGSGP
ncbi:cytoplasmic 60S subunit biogenesis factor REI1 homolog 1-like protein [Tanacetum coccineum]|uniref:Cytoplasmic 60S subunit biogenesis factor REI1 homolog 1-like protein n=1 Tax=Tanacetum coccineum TaxID=301880 RepID=A0ABQ5C4Q8_9ASTR